MSARQPVSNTTQNQATERYFLAGTAFNRILAEAPYLPRCSDDKTATRVRPTEYAIHYPYMQINRSGFVSWLIFDLDHKNSMIWEDKNLPAPNLIVRNPKNGHSHLYYAIHPVCTTVNARNKPIAYMKAVYNALAIRLEADPSFHGGPVAKTPGHSWWLTQELHDHVYELGKLADYVTLEVASRWNRGLNLDDVGHSRHCILFERLRHLAYSIVNDERENGTFHSFTQRLEFFATTANTFYEQGFSSNLPYSSIKHTVKSVARWTWNYYTGRTDCNRGVMQLSKTLPLAERQHMAAKRTHKERRNSTEFKIRFACRSLMEKGECLTQTAIARITNLARQTVAIYKYVIKEARVSLGTSTPAAKASSTANVKYAVYQVPAGRQRAINGNDLPLIPQQTFVFIGDRPLILDG